MVWPRNKQYTQTLHNHEKHDYDKLIVRAKRYPNTKSVIERRICSYFGQHLSTEGAEKSNGLDHSFCCDRAFHDHGVFGIWRETKTKKKEKKREPEKERQKERAKKKLDVSVSYIYMCIHNYGPALSKYSHNKHNSVIWILST